LLSLLFPLSSIYFIVELREKRKTKEKENSRVTRTTIGIEKEIKTLTQTEMEREKKIETRKLIEKPIEREI
jgi:hypothetical protein